jgi:hypothetical protein
VSCFFAKETTLNRHPSSLLPRVLIHLEDSVRVFQSKQGNQPLMINLAAAFRLVSGIC